ncbi:MAG: HWE histidine kinase domain-containing protein [Pseudomonadota bacterium]
MTRALSDRDLQQALDNCANESVHSPGTIQPIGWLLGCEIETGLIRHASMNCVELFGREIASVLGQPMQDLLGAEVWHATQNIAALRDFSERRYFAGTWRHDSADHALHVSKGGDYFVVEIEHGSEVPAGTPEMVREQTFLINQIQACADQESLFDLTSRLLRHVTGFDRVMIYKFDSEWNGEVLAETRRNSLEPFLGLKFPHWDIPEQARAIMARIQLRIVADVDQVPVALAAQHSDLPALDISLAQMRGVSDVHIQYLRNMGVGATMTLSVVLDQQLWGMISFHHEHPKVLQSSIRQILTTGIIPVFCLKLGLLRDRATLGLSQRLQGLQTDIQTALERGTSGPDILSAIGPSVLQALDVDGLAILSGSQDYRYGATPSTAAMENLAARARASENGLVTFESIATEVPGLAGDLDGVAGALALVNTANRSLLVFRREIGQTLSWAGNPTKAIEIVGGNARLQPRGSFAKYLEEAQGRCKPWSEQDRHLTQQLWPLLSAAERHAFMADLTRQRALMIAELNHRVRNILAMVKSVSSQTRRHGGSPENYGQSLEARIHALAAAHDIGAGAGMSAVSAREITALETAPFAGNTERVTVAGEDFSIRADLAPLFALVIHELMTNAVKHGAFSTDVGRIAIDLGRDMEGATLEWTESGGPQVDEPAAMGFGATLIRQALPHELGGRSTLDFSQHGVRAQLWLPKASLGYATNPAAPSRVEAEPAPSVLRNGLVLILEDNFMIATDLAAELEQLGFPNTEIFARPDAAMDFLRSETPALAFLDVNLGQGRTSESVATELVGRAIRTVFVTGYGDQFLMPAPLAGLPVLTKPISRAQLGECIARLVG